MTDNETQAPAFASPLGALRWKLRTEAGNMRLTSARDVRVAVAAVLDAPEWTQAAEEANALRTSLAHWKVFAEHAEGERSQMSADAARLDRFEDWLASRAGPLLHIDQIKEALK